MDLSEWVRRTVWSKGEGERGEEVRTMEIVAMEVGGRGSSSSFLGLDFGVGAGFAGVSTREIMLRQIARSGASLLHSFVLQLGLENGEVTFLDPCLWL